VAVEVYAAGDRWATPAQAVEVAAKALEFAVLAAGHGQTTAFTALFRRHEGQHPRPLEWVRVPSLSVPHQTRFLSPVAELFDYLRLESLPLHAPHGHGST
jgi:hypothetical protein